MKKARKRLEKEEEAVQEALRSPISPFGPLFFSKELDKHDLKILSILAQGPMGPFELQRKYFLTLDKEKEEKDFPSIGLFRYRLERLTDFGFIARLPREEANKRWGADVKDGRIKYVFTIMPTASLALPELKGAVTRQFKRAIEKSGVSSFLSLFLERFYELPKLLREFLGESEKEALKNLLEQTFAPISNCELIHGEFERLSSSYKKGELTEEKIVFLAQAAMGLASRSPKWVGGIDYLKREVGLTDKDIEGAILKSKKEVKGKQGERRKS